MTRPGTDLVVDTPSGPVRGRERGGVVEYLGLPYARAPRFGAPEPVAPWTAVRDATVSGPVPPQLPARTTRVFGPDPDATAAQGEDCLRVDVRVPAAATDPARPLPVLVWIHGGAYVIGSAVTPWYDTAAMVRTGAVVTVNVGYRLGLLGWWRSAGVSDGNLGLLDLLAALRWVASHVGAFGGDPTRVTAAGESAGAHAIAALLTTGEGRGLVGAAVLQSGQLGLGFSDEARARRIDGYVREGLDGADPTTADVATLLRAQRHTMIRAAGPGGVNSAPAFAPVAGVAPLAADVSWADTAAAGRPLVVGTNRDEVMTFVPLSPVLDRLHRLPVLGRAVAAGTGVATERVFAGPARRLADDAARAGTPVWTYRFDWSAPDSGLGACHGLELPFLYGTRAAWARAPMLAGADWDRDVAPLAGRMRAAWLRFVVDGDPSGPGPERWPTHVAGRGPGAVWS